MGKTRSDRLLSQLPQPQQQMTSFSFEQKYFSSWATATVQLGFNTLFHIVLLRESVVEHGDSGYLSRASAQRHCPSSRQTAWLELLNIV